MKCKMCKKKLRWFENKNCLECNKYDIGELFVYYLMIVIVIIAIEAIFIVVPLAATLIVSGFAIYLLYMNKR